MSDELFAKLVRNEISETTYLNGGKPVGYEVGARVKLLAEHDDFDVIGATGTIRVIGKHNVNEIGVEWDEDYGFLDFHMLGDWTRETGHVTYAPSGNGYWVSKHKLEVI